MPPSIDLAAVLEGLTDFVAVLDLGWRFVYVNHPGAAFLGRKPEELIGHSLWELFPGAESSPFYQRCQEALHARQPFSLRHHSPQRGVWLDLRISPSATEITIFGRDVTEQQRVETALRESEERLRLAQQGARIGTWDWDVVNETVSWSEGIWQLLGLPPHSLEPTPSEWIGRTHPDDLPGALAQIEAVLASGTDFAHEFRVIHPDGSALWVLSKGQVLRDEQGKPVRFIGVNIDISERKRSEQALTESEARYRFITEALPQVIWLAARDGSLQECNQQWYELTGLSVAQTLSGSWQQVLHPEDREALERTWPSHMEAGEPYEFEYRIRRAKDGAYRWHYGRAMPIRDEHGTVTGWLGTAFDTQGLKDAAERERHSEQLYRAFLEQAGEAFWFTNMEGRCLELNEAACRLLGYPREELLGSVVRELFHPDDQAGRKADLERVHSGQTVRAERRLRRKDGTYAIVEGVARAFDETRTLVFFRDVTRRREAEQALQEREERLRLATRAAGIGTFDWHIPSGRLVWTEQEELLFGLEPGTFGGTIDHWVECVLPEDVVDMERRMQQCMEARREDFDFDFRIRRPDGEIRWIEGSSRFFYAGDGTPLRMVGVNLDVTERRLLAEAQEARSRTLAEESRRKDEFLAMLAHELRNPLAPIANAAHLLGLQPDDPVVVDKHRETIQRNARHLSRLVDDLLEVARINEGKIDLRHERTELATVLHQAVASVQARLEQRRHELMVTLPPQPVVVQADPVRLVQVLVNLLTNAAKYTEPGGRIELALELEPTEAPGTAIVRVRDNGRGIDPLLLPQVFDLFVQGVQTLARSEGGLGVGLTLAQRLVEMHGGQLSAHSEGPGQGSEFTIRLPLLPEAEGAPAGETPSDTPAVESSRTRVLLVEDNIDAAETLAELLEIWGLEVAVAHEGQSALALAPAFRPELVLQDLGLPGMDGYEVAVRLRTVLRETAPEAEPPVFVALTGYGDAEHRRRTAEAGFDHHLVKPIDPEKLRALLLG